MAAKLKDAEVTALSEAMLQELELLRHRGDGAYPPRLRQLAPLAGDSPTDEQIQKAASKKLFAEKAVVVEKVERRPSLDSLVYFKEDVPTKPPAPKRPVKAKDEEVVALAEAMLRELELLRQTGDEAYPPKLRQLAALTGGSPTDELIQKAASKKPFTDKVVVEKDGKKPSLDSPVRLKEKEVTIPELAERMRLVLEAQRRLGADAYPPTLRRLAELCEINASDARVAKAADHEALTKTALVGAKKDRKPGLDAPVMLREDIETEGVLRALLRFALAPSLGGGRSKAKQESTAFTIAEVEQRLVAELQKPLVDALEGGMERSELPKGVAWIEVKGKPYLFLIENMKPQAAQPVFQRVDHAPVLPTANGRPPVDLIRPQREFATAFREAFDQLDRRNGITNFVKIADLRHALADFGRDAFDSGLRALRLNHEFSLDSHEGLYGALSPEEREAGLREAGSLLIYVSRR